MKKILLAMALMALIGAAWADWAVQEDFEDGAVPTGWIVIDEDGDDNVWHVIDDAEHAHSGSHAAFCQNFFPNENEDWLILPSFTVASGDSLHFFAASWASSENLQVLISTEDPEPNDFDYTLLELDDISTTYARYSLSLDDYADQMVYIAFMWEADTYGLLIDDVLAGSIENVQPSITLPDNFSFTQGETLHIDLQQYIENAQPENAQLTCSGDDNVTVAINGFQVDFSSPEWYGDETITFTVTNDNSADSDEVSVVVAEAPQIDLAAQRISDPQVVAWLDAVLHPALIIRNDGAGTQSESFDVSCLIIDSENETFYEESARCSQSIGPDESIEFVFPVSCTPDVEGDYDISFTIDLNDGNTDNNSITGEFIVAEHFGEGSPDAFGYSWIDSAEDDGPVYDWIDISQTGASAIMQGVDSFSGDDNFSETIDIGFDFPFYGVAYSSFHVDTNGEILFADNTWCQPYPGNGWGNDGNVFNWTYPLPGYAQMPALISVFWDDLEADEGVGDIYYQTFGEAPDRYCVIQWSDFRFHAGDNPQDYLNFEVILYENGAILMQYQNLATRQTGTQAPHDFGQSSTIGIQNTTADIGLCYLRELVQGSIWQGFEPEGNLPRNELAILFQSGEDMQPPLITFDELGNTFETTLEFEATIVDMSAIQSATLHYRTGDTWNTTDFDACADGVYHFTTPQVDTGVTFEYYFEASDDLGNSATLPADAPETTFSLKTLPSANTNLLLTYSGSQDHNNVEYPVYVEALDALGVAYDVYDWQGYETYRFPAQYDGIIAYANSGSGGDDTDTLATALVEYLDAGTEQDPANVFFASDGFATSQSGSPNSDPRSLLLTAYFRTSYIGTTIGGGTNGLAGPDYIGYVSGSIICLNDSPVGEPGDEITVYANTPDCLFEKDECPNWYADVVQNPSIGSHNAFAFEDGPVNGQAYLYHGVCGTWIDNLIYKGFYFSFDLSQITDSAVRTQLLSDALDWFGFDVGVAPEEAAPPCEITLSQNTPNPFNPETVIRFSIPQRQNVVIDVYNIRGEKVRTLLDEPMPAGQHSVTWVGRDANGRACASGVYFYRLRSGAQTQTRKMILLK